MATTADSSSNHHSPRGTGFTGDGVNSPQFRRRNLSAWAQVVRGDPESIPAVHLSSPSSSSSPATSAPPEQIPFSDCSPSKASAAVAVAAVSPDNYVAEESSDSNSGNAARPKKPAWNKPSNGVVEVPVMGADSWPALSETTRASPKSLPDSSSKPISDGSVSVSQAPAILHSPPKQATTNVNPNSMPNHALPVRQRSMKRGVGGTGGGPVQGGFAHAPPPPPPLPPIPVFEIPHNAFGKLVPAAVPDSTHREPPHRGNNWETRPIGGFVSQSHAVNDHPSPRNSSRRGNFGPHPRGDGYHNNYGGRHNQDRGNHDWNSRSSNVRDAHMQPHRAPLRNFVRHPPPASAPFISPQPVRPFGNPIGFPEMTSPVYIIPALPSESFRGMPFVTPPPPPAMYYPFPDPHLPTLLVNQIEYYFSDANLIKDEFLKSNMDEQGWVPITLIASFPRVKNLTNNIQLILDSMRRSTVVEVMDEKVRRRNEWANWIPTSGRVSTDSGLQSPGGSRYNMLATSFQKVTLEEVGGNQNSMMGKADSHTESVPGRCSSEELTGQSQQSNGEDTDQATCSSRV
ncbi:hypothetical protein L1049_026835 [Liquidambar formosana]|uniref:HTH La-type RNA-binding domain-containing protein n=1 Tax=Liquidambar formosana TaxID=63359 RepID=A0AAP0R6R5_LIQFO